MLFTPIDMKVRFSCCKMETAVNVSTSCFLPPAPVMLNMSLRKPFVGGMRSIFVSWLGSMVRFAVRYIDVLGMVQVAKYSQLKTLSSQLLTLRILMRLFEAEGVAYLQQSELRVIGLEWFLYRFAIAAFSVLVATPPKYGRLAKLLAVQR